VIVVGGGLSGFSAANTLLEHGADVVLLDKSAFCGGNSTKATSGINGGPTRTQTGQGIKDSVELFQSDCIKGGAKKPELVKTLCENSGADVEWLMDAFDLDLSLVARLGGHSAPRTHRGKERFPGMTITYALIEMFEKIVSLQKPAGQGRARMINKARVVDLIHTNGKVTGVVYEKDGQRLEEHGPVILATGGFGADFSEDSLLKKYRPDLLPLSTTNGEHCTGDGIKLGEKNWGANH
jgi:succinate dehydrogenase/fumarate reductase flavoprotein subunit